jgi:hypothetical protein
MFAEFIQSCGKDDELPDLIKQKSLVGSTWFRMGDYIGVPTYFRYIFSQDSVSYESLRLL